MNALHRPHVAPAALVGAYWVAASVNMPLTATQPGWRLNPLPRPLRAPVPGRWPAAS